MKIEVRIQQYHRQNTKWLPELLVGAKNKQLSLSTINLIEFLLPWRLRSDRLFKLKLGYWTAFEKSQNKHCGFKLHHEFWLNQSEFCPIIWSLLLLECLHLSSIASLTGQSEAILDCRGNGGRVLPSIARTVARWTTRTEPCHSAFHFKKSASC